MGKAAYGQTQGNGSAESIVYIDSPMQNAIGQVTPFLRSGILGGSETSLVIRKRSSLSLLGLRQRRGAYPVQEVVLSRWADQVPHGSKIYYPFNAEANMRLVANRKLRHVLVLHGESNKLASYRPASRLYDYVVVAGDLACRRYMNANIFTQTEIDGGRLIRMGDSFVQDYPYLRHSGVFSSGAILYAPTWETSTERENYSSAENSFGFNLARIIAQSLGCREIVVKLHPNYGARRPVYLVTLVNAIRRIRQLGISIKVIDESLHYYAKLSLLLNFGRDLFVPANTSISIAFALCDVSGMEAVFLKQSIPHMTIVKQNKDTLSGDDELNDIYVRKSVAFMSSERASIEQFENYQSDYLKIDTRHRNLVFSYSDQSLKSMKPSERFSWLGNYVSADSYWRKDQG